MSKFTFDFEPIQHVYTVDGVIYPSVSQVLPYNYWSNNTAAMQKGTYVHLMCEMYMKNTLDEASLDPILIPYLDAFRKFLYETKKMGIDGVIDIKSGAHSPCVELQIPAYIELVNHGIPRVAPETMPILEMPFYHPIYHYCGTPDIIIYHELPVREGHALYLKANGKYALKTIKNVRTNLEIFFSFLITKRWIKEKGLNDNEYM